MFIYRPLYDIDCGYNKAYIVKPKLLPFMVMAYSNNFHTTTERMKRWLEDLDKYILLVWFYCQLTSGRPQRAAEAEIMRIESDQIASRFVAYLSCARHCQLKDAHISPEIRSVYLRGERFFLLQRYRMSHPTACHVATVARYVNASY